VTIHTIARTRDYTKLLLAVFSAAIFFSQPLTAQRDLAGAPQILTSLSRLRNTGSILMIAAHPDDESTALLAYFARGRHLRTGYLSLTRGEGGQNLIGAEQGPLLGVIRTQELLAARRIDGAEQYFSRAIDFGFTRTADEAIDTWGRNDVISDITWVIRKFQPDAVVLRWTGTPQDGHGQHQASAILSREAVKAAADPARFPEQLKFVKPWQTRRVVVYHAGKPEKNALSIDVGEFDPVLGHSYSEIAGMSRSMHRSQGQGTAEPRGTDVVYLIPDSGPPATKDLFEDIDTSWPRMKGGDEIARFLDEAAAAFDPVHPEKSIPALIKARPLIAALHRPLNDLDETVAMCAGLWLDAEADRDAVIAGSAVKINAVAVNRSHLPVVLLKAEMVGFPATARSVDLPYNHPVKQVIGRNFPPSQPPSQPYWLREPPRGSIYSVGKQEWIGLADSPPLLQIAFHLKIGDQEIEITRPVLNRYVDHILGERTRPFGIVPAVTLHLSSTAAMFPDERAKNIGIEVQAQQPNASGEVVPRAPPGWTVEPTSAPFRLRQALEQTVVSFRVTPPKADARGELTVSESAMSAIDYPHIPLERVFAPAKTELVRADIRTLAHLVGYVMGTGDQVPDALRQIGCEVALLDARALATGDLSKFDAIVTGARAFNVRADLNANRDRLFEYVKNGGTLVVQYNTLTDDTVGDRIGPYPMKITHDRVTQENVPVNMTASPLLQSPNHITQSDFNGWVQERGLYFAGQWDQHYQSLLESHDTGQKPLPGGTLYTRYGRGAYVFTAYSWFRQLPAGVPGAFRIFANLLSAGKTQQ
jgi:LmbE family N-acetylglucosaminyl deacetylase